MTEDNQCYTSPDLRELLANYLADAKNTINKISVKLCPLWHVSQFQLRKHRVAKDMTIQFKTGSLLNCVLCVDTCFAQYIKIKLSKCLLSFKPP